MSTHSGPNIVEDGLVLSLDAANPKSFRGEPTTNLLPQPLSFETGYTKESWTGTITDNYGIAPDGTQTATLVSRTGGYLYKRNTTSPSFSIAAGDTITFSCWVKKNDSLTTSGKGISIWSYSLGSTIRAWSTEEIYSDRWTRLSVTYTAITGEVDFGFGFVGSHANQFSGSILIWHPQVEIKPYATDFVVGTRGSTVETGGGFIDLTGNSRNGTLVSNVSYSSSNRSVLFDATGEVVTAPLTSGQYNRTWETFTYCLSSVNTYNMIMGVWSPYFTFYQGRRYMFSCSIGGTQRSIFTPDNELSLNTWYGVAFTTSYDSGTGNTTNKIYVNGIEKSSGTYTGTPSLSASLSLGDGQGNNWYRFNGYISGAKVYDRTLSAEEIKQNFNALRGRYGI